MSRSDKTYLERPPQGNRLFRFYETNVSGKKLTVRYGRVGGVTLKHARTYSTGEEARTDAARRIRARQRNGYAQPGTPSARPVKEFTAPVLWKFKTSKWALGIFVDDQRCWIGNNAGQVYALDHAGHVERHFQFPDRVWALVGDEAWMYAGGNDGNVYDLSGPKPRLAYQATAAAAIDWLDIRGGILAVSDNGGGVAAYDVESRRLWSQKASAGGFTVRCDLDAIYHGHDKGVTAYAVADGKKLWQRKTPRVLFGWQTDDSIYVGTTANTILRLAKRDGTLQTTFKCDNQVLSCATSDDGKFVFGADFQSSLYCFDATGKRLWKLKTGCGHAPSMQFYRGHPYLVTSEGYLACVDVGEAAIKAALLGSLPPPRAIKAPKGQGARPTAHLETTRNAGKGVVLECVREGGQLRMHVVSAGYRKDWHVQFPRDVREEGARYVVDEVRVATRGGFYRAYGDIKRLEQGTARHRGR
jgi:outer membrane protein assembly factor BamB